MRLFVILVLTLVVSADSRADGTPRVACRATSVADGKNVIWTRSQGTAALGRRTVNPPTCIVFEGSRIVASTVTADRHQIIWDRVDSERSLLFPAFKQPVPLRAQIEEPDLAAEPQLSVSTRSALCDGDAKCGDKDTVFSYECRPSNDPLRDVAAWCARE